MEEALDVLREILLELQDINGKLDSLTGCGACDLSDVCSRLESVESVVNNVESTAASVETAITTLL